MITSIRTQRLILRLPNQADAPALFHTVNGSVETLSRFLSWCTPEYALSDAIKWTRGAEYDAAQGLGFHFLTFEQLSGDLIGSCAVTNRGSALGEDGIWNLGYWIRSSSEGRGFASEAIASVIDAARQSDRIDQLEIKMLATNDKSQRVAVKSGAQFIGIRDEDISLHGKKWPALVYRLTVTHAA